MQDPDSAASTPPPRPAARRIIGWVLFEYFVGVQFVLLAGAWYLYLTHRDWIKEHRNDDPYADNAMKVSGKIDTAFDQPHYGRTIRIDNREAMFMGEVDMEAPESERLYPTFGAAIEEYRNSYHGWLPSVSLVHFAFKRSDYEVIETVQRELQARCLVLLEALDREIAARGDGAGALEARSFIAAAQSLAGVKPLETNPAPIAAVARRLIDQFESGARKSDLEYNESEVAPRYARDPELEALFRTQRFLMGAPPDEAGRLFLRIVKENAAIREQFATLNGYLAALDNSAKNAHLLEHKPDSDGSGLNFLPTAMSRESGYIDSHMDRDGNPAGATWIGDMTAAVRTGRLDLAPDTGSGWYDRKLAALAPLVRTDLAYELVTHKLRASPAYRAFMAETFKGAWIATRETHIMRLEHRTVGIGGGGGQLELAPHFSVEPAPAVYWRMAEAYDWLAPRLPAESAATTHVLELAERARGLAALSFLELGIPPDMFLAGALPEGFPQRQAEEVRPWIEELSRSEIMEAHPQVVMPVAPNGRQWGIVGVRLRRVQYRYDATPKVGEFYVKALPADYWAPVAVAAEFSRAVPAVDFAHFCSQFDTVEECLEALGGSTEEPGDGQVSWETLLAILTLLVFAHVTWRTIRRVRQPFPRQVSWRRRLAWGGGLALAIPLVILIGLPWFAMHVVPRLTLTRSGAVWSAIAGIVIREELDYSLPVRWLNSTDAAIASAVRSESPPVQEVALNVVDLSVGRKTRWGKRTAGALVDVANTGGYDLVCSALESLAGIAGYLKGEEAHRELLDRLRPVLARFDEDPELVFYCCWLMEGAGFLPEDQVMIERAVRRSTNDIGWRMFAVHALILHQPDKAPYDVLADLGLLPEEFTPATPPLNRGLFENLQWAYSHLKNDLNESEDRKQLWRAFRNDPRLVELIINACRGDAEESDQRSYFVDDLGDDARGILMQRISSILLSAPVDQVDPAYTSILLNLLADWPYDLQNDESFISGIKRIQADGRGNQIPKTNFGGMTWNKATWGEVFTRILNPPPKYNEPAGIDSDSAPDEGLLEIPL